jgi:L-alanine-DL-glutamate epimerase-like enolase superfamily enzyme
MKITGLKCLHADAGCRNFDFLKITTDEGIIGWSEFNESFGGMGVSAVIQHFKPILLGEDPRAYERIIAKLFAVRRQASGGLVQQAIGAVENALLDIKARALGIPVYEMLGGPVREKIRLYWSHCGTYRVAWPEEMTIPPIKNISDIRAMGKEVVSKGYTALKTNIFLFDGKPRLHIPGFSLVEEFPALNAEQSITQAIRLQLEAFREGTGPEIDILVDLNFNFKTEGFLKMARTMQPFNLLWVEIDSRNPEALHYIRQGTNIPLASGECLFGRRDYKSYLENQSMDIAIIDVPWNGIAESLKIASLAEIYEVNVAPHNFYSHLSTFMSAHFSSVVANFRIMEIDVDTVPWYNDLVTVKPHIDQGHLYLSDGPGWGTEVNEEAVLAHPPKVNQWKFS